MGYNPVLLEIFKNKFSSVAEEMGMVLNRTAFSVNIKERRDYSCAIFAKNSDMIAQAAHIPVHLGSMPLSVRAAVNSIEMEEGDMVMLNDPFCGGTHLPDITLVAPFYFNSDKPFLYVANRAHHSDVGGMSPASMPLSTSIFQEGIIVPPIKLVEKGKIDRKILSFFLSNVRTPIEREGDFTAQIMANITGLKRLKEIFEKYGEDKVLLYSDEIIKYTGRITRKTIQSIPDGIYEFTDYMDDDGISDKPVKLNVEIRIKDSRMTIDFSESDTQVEGSVNAVRAITLSACLYVLRCLMPEGTPTNAGILKNIKVVTKRGTIVDAEFPAAVAGGNVETSQRIVDVLLGAFSKALPEKIPAASQGTMNNITIGGVDKKSGASFAYYETIGGGMGASAQNDGADAVHSHMTNTLNTPVEALEYSYPFFVTEYSIRANSGGKGKFSGGKGMVREIKVLCDVNVTVLSERRKFSPYGLFGGDKGCSGKNVVIRKNGKIEEKRGKFSCNLKSGDTLRIETPGGGGYGE